MKAKLLDYLICPTCLPVEIGLECLDSRTQGSDITAGRLRCSGCRRDYFIENGIAHLLPERKVVDENRYERQQALDSYLWSHYADLLDDPDAGNAYHLWAGLLPSDVGLSLDIGCAVGRFTFEMAARSAMAIGIDSSAPFIREARRLFKEHRHDFLLPLEGAISEQKSFGLPEAWQDLNIEFLVADALALPFRNNTFNSISSLNILDKVPHPLVHLRQADRVAADRNATFLISDPFSWSEEVANPQEWLGGHTRGPFAGRGIDNLRSLVEGADEVIVPWRIDRCDSVWWKIRNHANHFELIRSEYLVAVR
ncbi:MAG TPA: methyltransferase domain-containing protein [Desulfuromonadales bacterium]|nr:methyltransferase domain-containing protein [Desulfuromonadales bacterium]